MIPPIYLALVLIFGLPSIKRTLTCCRPVQATKLEHKLYKQRLRELRLLSLEKTRLLGDVSRYLCGAYREAESYFSPRCTERGSEATVTCYNKANLDLIKEKEFFTKSGGWLSTVPGCTDRLENLIPILRGVQNLTVQGLEKPDLVSKLVLL